MEMLARTRDEGFPPVCFLGRLKGWIGWEPFAENLGPLTPWVFKSSKAEIIEKQGFQELRKQSETGERSKELKKSILLVRGEGSDQLLHEIIERLAENLQFRRLWSFLWLHPLLGSKEQFVAKMQSFIESIQLIRRSR